MGPLNEEGIDRINALVKQRADQRYPPLRANPTFNPAWPIAECVDNLIERADVLFEELLAPPDADFGGVVKGTNTEEGTLQLCNAILQRVQNVLRAQADAIEERADVIKEWRDDLEYLKRRRIAGV